MKATGFTSKTGLKLEDGSVKFTTPVSELESGKNMMDNKAQDALKEKNFPQIIFNLKGYGPQTVSGKKRGYNRDVDVSGKNKGN